jgi:hypothetical protein
MGHVDNRYQQMRKRASFRVASRLYRFLLLMVFFKMVRTSISSVDADGFVMHPRRSECRATRNGAPACRQ